MVVEGVEDICREVDIGVLESMGNFERDSGYIGVLLKRINVDISKINGYEFSEKVDSDAGYVMKTCGLYAQDFHDAYESKIKGGREDLFELFSSDINEEKVVKNMQLISGVDEALRYRQFLLRNVFGAKRKSSRLISFTTHIDPNSETLWGPLSRSQ